MKSSTGTPRDLFFDQLRDLHSMAVQICETMPHLVDLTTDPGLRNLLESHAHGSCHQTEAIKSIFEQHGKPPGDDKCKAIAGLIEGGNEHLESVNDPDTRDLMMVAHCLRMAHYAMAAYEITARLAERLGLMHEPEILGKLLSEERGMAEALLGLEPEIFETANSPV